MLGSLHGVPLAHKDLIQVAGKEMHVGSKILQGNIAQKNAWVIDDLDAAGQVNLGALHMAEFAMSPTGFNGHYGHGLNPWNPEYPCGGSSSGSGIAVAARLVLRSCVASQALNRRPNASASMVSFPFLTPWTAWVRWRSPHVTVRAS
jgi:aspartyl-tRNA(Asn)/glutamyl-tRNA(Gln) amidotransferase subunit A